MQAKVVVLLASNGQGAGKSTLANLLREACREWNRTSRILNVLNVIVIGTASFARPLKETLLYLLTSICGLPKPVAQEHLYGSLKNAQLPGFPAGVTARKMLQHLGTEFREGIGDPELWRRLLVQQLKLAFDWKSPHRLVVIDDWRFIGELKYLEENLQGVQFYKVFVEGAKAEGQGTHASEGEITAEMCDCIIKNPQGLEPYALMASQLLGTIMATAGVPSETLD